jgi:hypothetical protein
MRFTHDVSCIARRHVLYWPEADVRLRDTGRLAVPTLHH